MTKSDIEQVKDLSRKMFECRNIILNPDVFDILIKGAESEDEKIFYSGVFNTALKIKQNEVMKNERY